MRTATLTRLESTDDYTLGQLIADGLAVHTLEPPWRDNARGVSCIPPGHYECERRKSPRYGETYWLLDTDPRQFILIHPGNVVRHTKGCILPGQRVGWLEGQRAVLLSRPAVREIEDYFGHQSFELEII